MTLQQQLIEWSNINSGSLNLDGLERMKKTLILAFDLLADEIQIIPMTPLKIIQLSGTTETQPIGDLLFIRKRPELKRRILLSGHMDTVFEKNHPFQSCTLINPNHLQGPGVCDMKGGLLVLWHALEAFEKTPEANTLGWDLLINPDEEIGSLSSALFYRPRLKQYALALTYEPALSPEGLFARHRKGSGHFTLVATGQSAHSGRSFEQGRNAILHLTKALLALDALNKHQTNARINIAQIQGGTALNIIPNQAVAKIEIRVDQEESIDWIKTQCSKLLKSMEHPDYHLALYGDFHRPVKHVSKQTETLFQQLQQIGQRIGLNLLWDNTGGCCDGNNFSTQLPVIDTLGVRGGLIHSDQEFVLLDSLPERIALNTLFLSHLAQGGLETL